MRTTQRTLLVLTTLLALGCGGGDGETTSEGTAPTASTSTDTPKTAANSSETDDFNRGLEEISEEEFMYHSAAESIVDWQSLDDESGESTLDWRNANLDWADAKPAPTTETPPKPVAVDEWESTPVTPAGFEKDAEPEVREIPE